MHLLMLGFVLEKLPGPFPALRVVPSLSQALVRLHSGLHPKSLALANRSNNRHKLQTDKTVANHCRQTKRASQSPRIQWQTCAEPGLGRSRRYHH